MKSYLSRMTAAITCVTIIFITSACAPAAPAAQDNQNAVVNALLALGTQPNSMRVTTVLSDGQAHNNLIEFVPPDRKHIVDLDQKVEYIIVAQKVYAKNSSGQWEETQIPASTFMADAQATAETVGRTISDVKMVRRDTLDDRPVIVYSYLSTTQVNGIELHGQTELWVGEKDGLPARMVVDGETLGVSTDPATGESKQQAVKALTTTLIDFDPALSIQPPLP
jgi:hypothetical protein